MSHYLNKYLKYKSKYLELKQVGSSYNTTTINLVTTDINKNLELISGFNKTKNVYVNTIVQFNENNNITNINTEAEDMYEAAKIGNYSDESFVSLYDNIGALYICSKPIQDLWNQLAADLKLNIAIFNGDNTVFRYINPDNYIVGINILKGCNTDNLAKKLNTSENNNKGIYFIGLHGTNHNYGSSFYMCDNRLEMTADEFVTEYEKYSTELPILRIIKIFFDKFKYCLISGCRNCSILTIEQIKEKLQSLKPKIDAKTNFTFKNTKDHYFNSKFQIKCESGNCTIDVNFEKYIRDIITKIYDKNKEEKDKRAEEIQKKKLLNDERDKLVLYIADNTNITKDYEKYFNKNNKNNLDEIFDGGIIYNASSDTIMNRQKTHYKIYFKKSSMNKEYYFFQAYNSQDDEFNDDFYTNKMLEHVNPDGSEYKSFNDSDSED